MIVAAVSVVIVVASLLYLNFSGPGRHRSDYPSIALTGCPAALALDPAGHHLYVPYEKDCPSGNGVGLAVVDTGSDSVMRDTALPAGAATGALAVDPAEHVVYMLTSQKTETASGPPAVSKSLVQIDVDRGTVVRSVPVTHEVIGGALALDPTSHLAYVVSGSDPKPEGKDPVDINSVAVVDTQEFAVRAKIPVADDPTNITVDPSSHRVYVASDLLHQSNGHNWINGTVSEIDPATLTVTRTITVGKFPTAMAIDPETHTLYVANCWDNSITLIDTASGAITATISNVDAPGTLAIDPIGHLIYATKYGLDTVSIIDTVTRKVLRIKNIGEQAAAAIFDPSTQKVYVANFSDHTLSVISPSSQ